MVNAKNNTDFNTNHAFSSHQPQYVAVIRPENTIYGDFLWIRSSLRRGLLYPFNYGSVLFPFRRRFSFYYIIRIKSNFLSRFISFCQNISRSCRNKRCAVTAAYGKRRNLFRTVARLKKARQVFDLPRFFVERATRIGLATEAWEAPILPLNYARV